MVRAYRVGQARFTRLFVEEAMRQSHSAAVDGTTVLLAVEQISEYIDRVVGQVLEIYDREQASWFEHRSAALSSRVREVLDGRPVDVDRLQAALGYRLRQRHVGLVVWLDAASGGVETVRSLHDLVVHVGRSLGCDESPLFVPCDESSAWAWLPVGARSDGVGVEAAIAESRPPSPWRWAVQVTASKGSAGHTAKR